jgi:hypothetical protein
MNRTHTANPQSGDRRFEFCRIRRRAIAGLTALASVLATVGCSSDKGDKEPTVTVQVAAVEKTTIQHTINAQAILFPRQQAAIVPKISAPVRKFLVKRGSPVQRQLRPGAGSLRNYNGRRSSRGNPQGGGRCTAGPASA